MRAFVVLGLVLSTPIQEKSLGNRLRNYFVSSGTYNHNAVKSVSEGDNTWSNRPISSLFSTFVQGGSSSDSSVVSFFLPFTLAQGKRTDKLN